MTQNFDAPEGGSSRHRPVADMVDAFVRFPKLLVAIINGPTIGISATIVALCDIIYASETAYFYAPFTSLGNPLKSFLIHERKIIICFKGLCAEGCASITFPRILGPSKANEVLQLNHRLTAQEALDFKFVAFVYKDVQDIWKKLNQISELPLGSIIANKKLTRKFEIENLIEINDCEMEEMGQIFNSDHAKQARQKFLQMRRNKSKL